MLRGTTKSGWFSFNMNRSFVREECSVLEGHHNAKTARTAAPTTARTLERVYEALSPGGEVPTLPSLLVVSVTDEVMGIVTCKSSVRTCHWTCQGDSKRTVPLVEKVGKKDTLPL